MNDKEIIRNYKKQLKEFEKQEKEIEKAFKEDKISIKDYNERLNYNKKQQLSAKRAITYFENN